jgi:PAS domain S-box-containing protein
MFIRRLTACCRIMLSPPETRPKTKPRLTRCKSVGRLVRGHGITNAPLCHRVTPNRRGAAIPEQYKSKTSLLQISILLSILLVIGGSFAWFDHAQLQARKDAGQDMLNAATQRQQYFASDLHERQGDARILAARPNVWHALSPDLPTAIRATYWVQVQAALAETAAAYGYFTTLVLDTQLHSLTPGPIEHMGAIDADAMRQAMASGHAVFANIHREPSGILTYGIAAPVYALDRPGQKLLGVVYLERDATQLLAALLRPWPSSWHSLQLSFQSNEANKRKFLTLQPASQAAPQAVPSLVIEEVATPPGGYRFTSLNDGNLNIVDAIDRRHIAVIAASTPENALHWALVARVDRADIEAPLRNQAATFASLASATLLLVGLIASYYLRNQFMRSQLREAELSAQYRASIQIMVDGFIRITEAGIIDDANEAAHQITGYRPGGLLGLPLDRLRARPKEISRVTEVLSALRQSGRERLHTQWRRLNGSIIDIDITATFVAHQNSGFFYFVLRDITVELAARRRLERLNNLHHLLEQSHRIIQHSQDPREVVTLIGQAVAVDPRIVLVMTGWVDREAGVLRLLAATGPAASYTDTLHITLDPDLPSSQGPSGTAIRENRIVIASDFRTDPRTQLWRQTAEHYGLRSSASIPLNLNGEVVGCLALYSNEAGYFDIELVDLIKEIGTTVSLALEAAQSRQLSFRMQNILQASEARLRRILASSPVPMQIASITHKKLLAFNKAFETVFGYNAEQFGSAEEWFDHAGITDDIRQLIEQSRAAALAARNGDDDIDGNGTSVIFPECELSCADGTRRLVQGSYAQVGDDEIFNWVDLTELRRREIALRRREDIFRAIVEQAADAIVLVEAQSGMFLEVNSMAHNMLGYTRDEFLQRTLTDIQVNPDTALATRTLIELHEQGALTLQRAAYHRDGHILELRVSVRKLIIDDTVCFTMIWTDITEELRNQQALKSEAEKLRILFDRSPHGIATITPEGRLVGANDRFISLMGGVREDTQHTSINDWGIHLPDIAALRQAMRFHADLPAAEIRVSRYDGRNFDASIIWSIAELADGPLLYCSVIDISQIKDSERELERINANLERIVAERTADLAATASTLAQQQIALQASNDELTAIFNSAPVGIALIKDERIIRCNPNLEEMFGYEQDELNGQPIRIGYATNEFYAQSSGKIQNLLAAKTADARGEYEFVRKDGTRFWGRVRSQAFSTTTIRDSLLSMIEDITQERMAAEALRNAKELAEAANRAKTTFLATMSHEIRTPLNGIIGMSEVLLHQAMSSEHAKAISTIHDSGRSLMSLIDDLLDFSKIEADKIELEKVPMSVIGIIDTVCNSLLPSAQTKSVDLSVFVAPDVPEFLLADPTRLRQILYNVAGNAIKFSGGRTAKRGHVAIRVEVATVMPLYLRFRIIDNGIGMSKEVVDQLFTPFMQAEASTTRRFGGTGLGLAITRRLVERKRGEILVNSSVGVGSEFIITLPLEPMPAPPADDTLSLTGMTCLLFIEVDHLAPADLRLYLESAGAQVLLMPDAGSAIAQAALAANAVIIHAQTLSLNEAQPQPWPPHIPHVHLRYDHGWTAILHDESDGINLGWLERTTLLRVIAVAAGKLPRHVLAEAFIRDLSIQPKQPPTVAEARAAGQLILLAEDDEINRKVILWQLNLLGYAAECAINGKEALQMWRQGRYGLVLTDLSMPEMDGYQLTAAIRGETGDRAAIPIFALSANALRGEAEAALHRGFDIYLTKPILLADLDAALSQVLGGQDRAPQSQIFLGQSTHMPTESQSEKPALAILDAGTLVSQFGNDPALINDILAEFKTVTVPLAAALRLAIAASDGDSAARLTHRLKSSSRWIGAQRLGEICALIEETGKAGNAAALNGLITEFDRTLADVLIQIDAYSGHAAAGP